MRWLLYIVGAILGLTVVLSLISYFRGGGNNPQPQAQTDWKKNAEETQKQVLGLQKKVADLEQQQQPSKAPAAEVPQQKSQTMRVAEEIKARIATLEKDLKGLRAKRVQMEAEHKAGTERLEASIKEAHQTVRECALAYGYTSYTANVARDKLGEAKRLLEEDGAEYEVKIGDVDQIVSKIEAEIKAVSLAKDIRYNAGQWHYFNGRRWYHQGPSGKWIAD